MGDPNPTIYLQNLGESCKRPDVKRLLYGMFSAHGKVLDVIVSPKMRGQAFIVFEDLKQATAARRREDGQPFLGKRMRIQYAKSESHATVLHTQGPEALYLKKLGIMEKQQGGKLTVSSAQRDAMGGTKNKRDDDDEDEDGEAANESLHQPKQKKLKTSAEDDDEAAMEEESEDEDEDSGPQPANGASIVQEAPHHVLSISNLPSETTSDMLTVLFQQFPGYASVRYQSVSGTAHAVYENWSLAADAKKALDGFQIAPDTFITVKFADPSVTS